MNSLIIDCSAGMGVYLKTDNNEFSFVDSNSKKHSDCLLEKVDDLLASANISIFDIDNLGVCVGPGSFTGIRVAVSLVKGLVVSIKDKVNVFVLSNFDIYDVYNKENSVLILDGFSNLVYVRKYQNHTFDDSCVEIEAVVKYVLDTNADVYVQSQKLQNELKKYEINTILAQNSTVKCFCNQFENGNKIDISQINPIYLRSSQAELEREKKLAGKK
ncbi:MAG: tRNA (adenosine(37)-N6)-threonylcarbamoyltransferase complex dimerization subunit type 1 TsaB [Clostridia bacterium]|nr:tRNA (adenosine(37)-N6)-threonylcarbamoyltransferase complex dimerization subunit type 1 TsaB [Clostridia bacterium]